MPSNWTQILSKYVKKWFIIYIFLQTKNPGVVHKAQGTMASAVYFETSVHHSASSLFSYLLLPSSFSYHDFFFFFLSFLLSNPPHAWLCMQKYGGHTHKPWASVLVVMLTSSRNRIMDRSSFHMVPKRVWNLIALGDLKWDPVRSLES